MTLFLGAGISAACGYPQWSSFLRQQAERARALDEIDALLAQGDYEGAAGELERQVGKNYLASEITRIYGVDTLSTAKSRGVLPLLPAISRGSSSRRTSTGSWSENSSGTALRSRSACGGEAGPDAQGADQRVQFLLKIHGDAEDRDDRASADAQGCTSLDTAPGT